MLRTRVLLLVSVSLLATFFLAGCGGESNSNDSVPQVRIVEWTFPDSQPVLTEPEGKVQELGAGIQFELQAKSGDPNRLLADWELTDVKFLRGDKEYSPTEHWVDENKHSFYKIDDRDEPFDYTATGNLHTGGIVYPFSIQFKIIP